MPFTDASNSLYSRNGNRIITHDDAIIMAFRDGRLFWASDITGEDVVLHKAAVPTLQGGERRQTIETTLGDVIATMLAGRTNGRLDS
jgi:hypothetical protein